MGFDIFKSEKDKESNLALIPLYEQEQESLAVLHSFANRLVKNPEDFQEEYTEIVDKNFWNLL